MLRWIVGALCWLQAVQLVHAQSIWMTKDEMAALPVAGTAWKRVKQAADGSLEAPNLSNQDQRNNVQVLAKALVFARTGETKYRDEVIHNCLAVIDTEQGGTTLSLGRELCAYVVAADLIGWRDPRFTEWLKQIRHENLQGQTLVSTHEKRPNNWGTHAGASRAAVAAYLGDRAELERTAKVFKGWLGDRSAYAAFKYRDLSWQADPRQPVGINPKGAVKDGHSIDGALPDDMRRGGSFRWPPEPTGYAWEALQGALVQAEILHRQGFPAWDWEDRALLRAVEFLHAIDWPATGDDRWLVWLVNYRYGTSFPADPKASPGKNMAWTNWTHQGRPAASTATPTVGRGQPAPK